MPSDQWHPFSLPDCPVYKIGSGRLHYGPPVLRGHPHICSKSIVSLIHLETINGVLENVPSLQGQPGLMR